MEFNMKLNKEQLDFLIGKSQTYWGKVQDENRRLEKSKALSDVTQKKIVEIDKELAEVNKELMWAGDLLDILREMKGGK